MSIPCSDFFLPMAGNISAFLKRYPWVVLFIPMETFDNCILGKPKIEKQKQMLMKKIRDFFFLIYLHFQVQRYFQELFNRQCRKLYLLQRDIVFIFLEIPLRACLKVARTNALDSAWRRKKTLLFPKILFRVKSRRFSLNSHFSLLYT